MKKAIGVGLFLLGFVAAVNFFLPMVARAEKEQPAESISTAKDLLMADFEAAKTLYEEGDIGEAEGKFKAVTAKAQAEGIDLGRSVERSISKYLAAIEKKREQEKRDALLERFSVAKDLYAAGKYTEAEADFLKIKADSEAEGIGLGFWTTRSLNSYIKKSGKMIADAEAEAAVEVVEVEAAPAEDTLKADLLAKFEAGKTLHSEGKYQEAMPVLQEVSDAAAANDISFGFSTDRQLRRLLADSHSRIIDMAAADEAAAERQREAEVMDNLLAQFAEGEALYNAGDYAGAKAAFEEIQATRQAEDVSLGFSKNRAVSSYISKSDKAIAKAQADAIAAEEMAAAEAARAAEMAEAEAMRKEAEERKAAEIAAAEEAARIKLAEEEAARAEAEAAKAARAAREAEVVAQFQAAQEMYKAGNYAEAKPILLDVQSICEAEGIKLGFWDARALSQYLKDIDARMMAAAEEAEATVAAEAAPEPVGEAVAIIEDAEGEADAAPVVEFSAEVAQNVRAEAAYQAGLEAFQRDDFQGAQKNALKALALKPGYAEASVLLELSNKKVAEMAGSANEFEMRDEVMKQAIENQIRDSLAEVRKAMIEKDYLLAERYAQEAKSVAEANVMMGFDNYVIEANQLLEAIAPRVARARAEAERAKVAEGRSELDAARKAAQDQVKQNVKTLMSQAWQNIRMEDYDAAAQDLDSVLKLMPDHAFAKVTRERVVLWAAQKTARDNEASRLESVRGLNLDASERMIFDATTYIEYPPNWLAKMEGRDAYTGVLSGDPESNLESLEVEKKLNRRLANFDFTNQPFSATIQFLRLATPGGVNIVVDDAAVTMDETVSLQLANASVRSILDLITAKMDLKWTIVDNYVYISDVDGINRIRPANEEMTRVYDIQDLIAPVEDWYGTQGGGGGRGGGGGGGGGRGGGGGGRGGGGNNNNSGGGGGRGGRRFGGDFGGDFGGGGGFGGGGFGGGFGGGVGGPGGGGAGGGGGQGGRSGGSYTDTDTAGYNLANELMQVVDRSIWNQAPDLFTVRYFTGGRLIVFAPPDTQKRIQKFLSMLREMRAMSVMVESSFINVDSGYLDQFDVNYPSVNFFAEDDGGAWTTFTASFEGVAGALSGPVSGTPVGGVVFDVNYLDGIEVDAIITAVRADINSQSLNWSQIMLANNQAGYLDVLTERDYVSDITTTVAESAVATELTVSQEPFGTTLQVRPTISYDRRYVQIDFQPTVSDIISTNLVSFTSDVDVTNSVELLTTSETSIRANISIPDGGTVVVGGFGVGMDAYVESGVPILSNLPLIGKFFKSTETISDKRNLIIFVTPHIVIREEYEAAL